MIIIYRVNVNLIESIENTKINGMMISFWILLTHLLIIYYEFHCFHFYYNARELGTTVNVNFVVQLERVQCSRFVLSFSIQSRALNANKECKSL